jgi:hypothetical protein
MELRFPMKTSSHQQKALRFIWMDTLTMPQRRIADSMTI